MTKGSPQFANVRCEGCKEPDDHRIVRDQKKKNKHEGGEDKKRFFLVWVKLGKQQN